MPSPRLLPRAPLRLHALPLGLLGLLAAHVIAPRPARAEEPCLVSPATSAPTTPAPTSAACAELERASAERLAERAARSAGVAARSLYDEAAEAYLATFHARCEVPVAARAAPTASRCEELAYNAARAFVAAGHAPRAVVAYRAVVAFDPRAPLAKSARLELGRLFQTIAELEAAADELETYARLYPAEPEAPDALADAVVLRVGAGDAASARRGAELFHTLYARANPGRAAELRLGAASAYAARDDWPGVAATLGGHDALFARAAVDLRVRARGLLARAHAHGSPRERATAAREYEAIVAEWGDGEAAAKNLAHAYPREDEGARLRRLARALVTVGEATYQAAEEARAADVDSLPPPVYAGPLRPTAIRAHLDTRVRDWATKKRLAIEKTEELYKRVLLVRPVPPPRWVVDAAARVAGMWGAFGVELRRVVPEAAMHLTTADGVAFIQLVYAVADPIYGRARPAYRTCAQLSTKYAFVDELSRGCDAWLVKMQLLPRLDELLPAAQPESSPVVPSLPARDTP